MWSRQGFTNLTPNAEINTTDGRDAFSEWQVRLSSNLQVWKGIEMTPMLRAQAGRPYSPTFIARLNYQSNVTVKASPRGEQRNDNVAVFDIRVAKAFTLGQGMKLRGFLDVYNITNTNAVQDMTVSYGIQLSPALADQRTSDRARRRALRVLARGSWPECGDGRRSVDVRRTLRVLAVSATAVSALLGRPVDAQQGQGPAAPPGIGRRLRFLGRHSTRCASGVRSPWGRKRSRRGRYSSAWPPGERGGSCAHPRG